MSYKSTDFFIAGFVSEMEKHASIKSIITSSLGAIKKIPSKIKKAGEKVLKSPGKALAVPVEEFIGKTGKKVQGEVKDIIDQAGTSSFKNLAKAGLGLGVGGAAAVGVPYATYKGIKKAFDGKEKR